MSVLVDASSPAMVNGSGTGNLTCASFTPPAGSLLVAVACAGYGNTPTIAISDSGAGTWTSRATSNNSAGDGCIQISTRVIGSSSSMTVTAAYTNLLGGRMLGVYVMTNADTASVGASATLTVTNSTTMTKSLTTTVTGSLVVGGVDNAIDSTGGTASLAANTSWPSMTGTDPAINSADQVAYGIIKSTSVTGTPGAKTYGVTWGTAAYGQIALLEVVPPAVSIISGADSSSPAANNAVVQANIHGADTGAGTESASLSVAIAATDTGSGTDVVQKITIPVADTAVSDEAPRIVSGGSTLAVASDVATATESGPILIHGAVDSGSFIDSSQAAVAGPLPDGPRIVRIQPD